MNVEDGPYRNSELFDRILEDQGISFDDEDSINQFIDGSITDSIVLGACERCGTVSYYCEPDGRMNHCEACGSYRVRSVLVILWIL